MATNDPTRIFGCVMYEPLICTGNKKPVNLFKKLVYATSVNEWTPFTIATALTGRPAGKAGKFQACLNYLQRVYDAPKSAANAHATECIDAADLPINPLAESRAARHTQALVITYAHRHLNMANSAPPGSKEYQAEKKRKDKNKARNARRKMRRTQGPLYPYALHVRAGPSRNQAISLKEWRAILTEAATLAYEMIDTRCKAGGDQNNFMLHVASFVEHVPPELRVQGKKTSDRPAEDRFGHGLALFMRPEAKDIYNEAFRQVIFQRDGESMRTFAARKKQNVRARYMLRIQQPLWVPLQIADNFYTSMRRGDPNLPQENGIKLESVTAAKRFTKKVDPKTKKTSVVKVPEDLRAEALVIFSANKAWEQGLNTANNKIKTPFGIFSLRKLNSGRSQDLQDETEAHDGYDDDDDDPFEDAGGEFEDDQMDEDGNGADEGAAGNSDADAGPAAGAGKQPVVTTGVAAGTRSQTSPTQGPNRNKSAAVHGCGASPAHKKLFLQPSSFNRNKNNTGSAN